jgi:hypothetical protein
MTGMAFSAGALDANRAGRLGPDQLRDLQASVRYRRRGLVGHLLHSGDAFAQDVAGGQVASVEGAITKKILQPTYGTNEGVAPPSYQIWVASRQAGNQQFKSGNEFYDSAPDDGFVRLFYLLQSKWAVNFERLPDAPPKDRRLGDRTEQALLDWRAARKAHDAVGEAEARAGMASIRREFASYLPEHGLPAHEQLAPGRLREAIIGDWESPFLSISVRTDGTLSTTMGAGAAQAGRWSVDPAGRVVTDVMGASMAIEASVAGDVLTLIINGQALNLRRSPA